MLKAKSHILVPLLSTLALCSSLERCNFHFHIAATLLRVSDRSQSMQRDSGLSGLHEATAAKWLSSGPKRRLARSLAGCRAARPGGRQQCHLKRQQRQRPQQEAGPDKRLFPGVQGAHLLFLLEADIWAFHGFHCVFWHVCPLHGAHMSS